MTIRHRQTGALWVNIPGAFRATIDNSWPHAANPTPRDRDSTSKTTSVSHLPRDFLRPKSNASNASGPSNAPVGSMGV
jgi:hypothetical protein